MKNALLILTLNVHKKIMITWGNGDQMTSSAIFTIKGVDKVSKNISTTILTKIIL